MTAEARDDARKQLLCDSRLDINDLFVLVAVVAVLFGIVLVAVGYLFPRSYRFDSEKPARQMEAIELYYAELDRKLDLCIIVGTAFIATGGLLLTAMMLWELLRGECLSGKAPTGATKQFSYGSLASSGVTTAAATTWYGR